jgi:hypothetical protein
MQIIKRWTSIITKKREHNVFVVTKSIDSFGKESTKSKLFDTCRDYNLNSVLSQLDNLYPAIN